MGLLSWTNSRRHFYFFYHATLMLLLVLGYFSTNTEALNDVERQSLKQSHEQNSSMSHSEKLISCLFEAGPHNALVEHHSASGYPFINEQDGFCVLFLFVFSCVSVHVCVCWYLCVTRRLCVCAIVVAMQKYTGILGPAALRWHWCSS